MEFKKAEQLLENYTNGTANAEERALVESWYLNHPTENALDIETIQHEHDLGLGRLNSYLHPTKKIKLWPRLAAAAVLVLMASVALYFYSAKPNGIKDKISLAQDIPPGKNVAFLTLANGKTINLSSSQKGVIVLGDKLTYSDGSPVSEATSVMTINTPRGGIYILTLPDGTKVMMNSETSLKFPSVFTGKNRMVEVTGEAYFEVAKDKSHPFIVQSQDQTVEVLGTHFNVNSYADLEPAKTTLLEGSVKISGMQNAVVLIPGQQAKLTNGLLHVKSVDTEEAVAWKNGYFRFNDENIVDVMHKIARWYDVEIVFKDKPTTEGFTGAISRFSNISDVLAMLEGTKIVHFDMQGRRVMVMN